MRGKFEFGSLPQRRLPTEETIRQRIETVQKRVREKEINIADPQNLQGELESVSRQLQFEERPQLDQNRKIFKRMSTIEELNAAAEGKGEGCMICFQEFNKKRKPVQCQFCAKCCCSDCCHRYRANPQAETKYDLKALICDDCSRQYMTILLNHDFYEDETLLKFAVTGLEVQVAKIIKDCNTERQRIEKERERKEDPDNLKKVMRLANLKKQIAQSKKEIDKLDKEVVSVRLEVEKLKEEEKQKQKKYQQQQMRMRIQRQLEEQRVRKEEEERKKQQQAEQGENQRLLRMEEQIRKKEEQLRIERQRREQLDELERQRREEERQQMRQRQQKQEIKIKRQQEKRQQERKERQQRQHERKEQERRQREQEKKDQQRRQQEKREKQQRQREQARRKQEQEQQRRREERERQELQNTRRLQQQRKRQEKLAEQQHKRQRILQQKRRKEERDKELEWYRQEQLRRQRQQETRLQEQAEQKRKQEEEQQKERMMDMFRRSTMSDEMLKNREESVTNETPERSVSISQALNNEADILNFRVKSNTRPVYEAKSSKNENNKTKDTETSPQPQSKPMTKEDILRSSSFIVTPQQELGASHIDENRGCKCCVF